MWLVRLEGYGVVAFSFASLVVETEGVCGEILEACWENGNGRSVGITDLLDWVLVVLGDNEVPK